MTDREMWVTWFALQWTHVSRRRVVTSTRDCPTSTPVWRHYAGRDSPGSCTVQRIQGREDVCSWGADPSLSGLLGQFSVHILCK